MDANGWLLSLCVYGLPAALLLAIHLGRRRRRGRSGEAALREASRSGLGEPATLHPSIDPSRCLGCGSCVPACPEGDVLGLVEGKARLVDPTRCIGHGACADACPTRAITLVLGSEERGVEIPQLSPSFETSVPGLYAAGEVGGMGLIRNAVEQGRQALEAIRAAGRRAGPGQLDLVIVGAGPAGLAAALAAREHDMRFVVLEQESLGGTVAHYPRGKLVMTAPLRLPTVGRVSLRDSSKEALLELWLSLRERAQLPIHEREAVEAVEPRGQGFEVRTATGRYAARSVLLAIGRRGTPRRLDVTGEEQDKVVYRLVDPEQYRGQHVLVVGGGDSALEAAASLSEEPGTTVTLCYRGQAFQRARPANRTRVEEAARRRRLALRLGCEVAAIGEKTVRVRSLEGEEELPNDAVIVCAGGVLPTAFLESMGVACRTCRGEPLQ